MPYVTRLFQILFHRRYSTVPVISASLCTCYEAMKTGSAFYYLNERLCVINLQRLVFTLPYLSASIFTTPKQRTVNTLFLSHLQIINS